LSGVVVFGCTLIVGVLISERARRSVLSTAVLLLAVGILLGDRGLGVVTLDLVGHPRPSTRDLIGQAPAVRDRYEFVTVRRRPHVRPPLGIRE
jgi:hypothetical protein